MVHIICDKCGNSMDLIDEDSRQEWYEGYYECDSCNLKKRHRKDFDQGGLTIREDITDEEE